MTATFTNLIYHVVFSTKNRELMILDSFKEKLYEYIGGIVAKKGGKLFSIGGTLNHVHLVVKLKPGETVSKSVGELKGISSRWVNEKKLFNGYFLWQTGFSAFTVSESLLQRVVKYVESQEEHHKMQSFKDEFIALLQKHSIPYDPDSMWD